MSIIIVTINEKFFQKISNSIKCSTSLDVEIIKVENEIERLSITKAYNKGAKKAKYNYLVFVHEDVIFHTNNWDSKLIEYFCELNSPGILGVAGASYLPISPSDWWLSDSKYLHANFLSNDKKGTIGEGILKKWGYQISQPVFVLDGMFLAMKKSVWEEFSFDESLLGFHGYDTSICLQVSQKYQNYFIPGILLEHFSKGYPNNTWLINTIRAKESIEPYIKEITKNQTFNISLELKVYHLFLNQLKKFSHRWILSFKYSIIYLIKLNKHCFSLKSWLLCLGFQGYFFLKLFKR